MGLTLMATGCRSSDPALDRSEQAVTLLVDKRKTLLDGEQTVSSSQNALQVLQQTAGDLRPAFDAFQKEIDNVRKEADRARAEAAELRARAIAYCTARQSDVSTISNDNMRKTAETRTAQVRDSYEHIDALYTDVNAAYAAYLRNLNDLQTYLANELNYPALHSAQPWVAESQASGESLRSSIRLLTIELNKTSNRLSPVPLPATDGPGLYSPEAYARLK
ncbi:MAG TPA: DUF2959 family protein [Tepidisphaeraceae bacterium]|jgi:chromosome segregation ATPase